MSGDRVALLDEPIKSVEIARKIGTCRLRPVKPGYIVVQIDARHHIIEFGDFPGHSGHLRFPTPRPGSQQSNAFRFIATLVNRQLAETRLVERFLDQLRPHGSTRYSGN